jgi:hypothetical protein
MQVFFFIRNFDIDLPLTASFALTGVDKLKFSARMITVISWQIGILNAAR